MTSAARMALAVAAAAASAEAAASSDRRVRTSQLPFAPDRALAGAVAPAPPLPAGGPVPAFGPVPALGPVLRAEPGLSEPGRPVRAGSKAVTAGRGP